MDEVDDIEEWGDEYDDDDLGHDDNCDRCGPWCSDWGGDGLCMLVIEQQAKEHEDYEENFVKSGEECPICKVKLVRSEIPTDEIWAWPGDFYNPMIAISIMGVLDTPKGVIHRDGNLYHVWIGEGEYREEKLILLSGKQQSDDLPF